jgi:hypothetical protein
MMIRTTPMTAMPHDRSRSAEAANQKNEAAFANTSFDSNEKGNDDLSKIAQNRC